MIKKVLFGGAGGGDKFADAGILVIRLFFGLAMCLAHGLPKMTTNYDKFMGGVANMGLAFPKLAGLAAIAGETLLALFIALGLLTRVSSILAASVMAVAAFVVHGADPFGKKELALAYLAAYIALAFTGGGRFSIDRLINKA